MAEPKVVGKYEIVEEIGRGGFATVYKARDPSLDRAVALKVLHGGYAGSADVTHRFLVEARKAAGLRHNGIVHIYEADEFQGQLYIAMEYLPGGTLAQQLIGKPFPFDAALSVLERVAGALDYAHKHQLVHRDVKPANILFDDEGHPVLVDFGLVKSLLESGYTVEGTTLGTPRYMAPEQAQPGSAIGAWTDVYALGIVAFEMLTGRAPFEADTPLAVLRAQVDTPPPDPRAFNPSLGPDVGVVVLKAINKLPAERLQSAGEFAHMLRQAAESRARQHVQQQELAQLLDQAQAACKAGDWLALQDLCVKVMQLDRTHPDALTMMLEASEGLRREGAEEVARRERGRRYEAGERALAAGQWQAAITAFEEVAAGNPDFKDVQVKLAQARDELQRAQWYDEAIVHAEAKHWAEACRTWINVVRGRMDYHNGDAAARLLDATDTLLGQLDGVRQKLEQQRHDLRQAREALALFDAMASAIEKKDWVKGVEAGEKLAELAPKLERPRSWLVVARSHLERQGKLGQDRMTSEKDGKEMVRIPAGEFLYGDKKEKRALPEFWMDKTPVTNAEYAHFVAATNHEPPQHWTGKTPPKNIADHPVTYVSWHHAIAYAKWAGKRLPTEEEWEKAARGTDGRTYPWANQEPTPKLCNFGQNEKETTPVGKYSPQGDSPYGCVDMTGNVWEWTASDYERGGKVLRGGGWDYGANLIRASSRGYRNPDYRFESIGFRCVGGSPGE